MNIGFVPGICVPSKKPKITSICSIEPHTNFNYVKVKIGYSPFIFSSCYLYEDELDVVPFRHMFFSCTKFDSNLSIPKKELPFYFIE